MNARATEPQPGVAAKYDDRCQRCDEPIVARVTRVVFTRGRPIHVECANGWSDE